MPPMDANSAWCIAILCVAILNTCNYVRHSFRVRVFCYFGRIALSTSGLIYLILMAAIPTACTMGLFLIPLDAELFASEISEVALLTGSAWASNHAMSWLSLGVIPVDHS